MTRRKWFSELTKDQSDERKARVDEIRQQVEWEHEGTHAVAVIILPSVYSPYLEPCLAGLADDVRELVTVVDNTTRNLGVAASWNLGANRVLAGEADWLVSLSAATRFGPAGGRDFLGYLEESQAWVVESETPVGWHCIAWSRALLERVGTFDENFWPAYGEDADISHRIGIAMREDTRLDAWETFPTDAWITMRGHATQLARIVPHMDQTILYFERKWGSWSHIDERYTRPFNNPDHSLSYWSEPERVG